MNAMTRVSGLLVVGPEQSLWLLYGTIKFEPLLLELEGPRQGHAHVLVQSNEAYHDSGTQGIDQALHEDCKGTAIASNVHCSMICKYTSLVS